MTVDLVIAHLPELDARRPWLVACSYAGCTVAIPYRTEREAFAMAPALVRGLAHAFGVVPV